MEPLTTPVEVPGLVDRGLVADGDADHGDGSGSDGTVCPRLLAFLCSALREDPPEEGKIVLVSFLVFTRRDSSPNIPQILELSENCAELFISLALLTGGPGIGRYPRLQTAAAIRLDHVDGLRKPRWDIAPKHFHVQEVRSDVRAILGNLFEVFGVWRSLPPSFDPCNAFGNTGRRFTDRMQ